METHGADPAKWPEAERAELTAFLADEAELGIEVSQTLDEARALDASLDLLSEVPTPPTLRVDLLAEAHATLSEQLGGPERQQGSLSNWLVSMGREFIALAKPPAIAGVMASALAIGVWFGATISVEPLQDEEVLTAYGEDYWDDDEGFIDLIGETL